MIRLCILCRKKKNIFVVTPIYKVRALYFTRSVLLWSVVCRVMHFFRVFDILQKKFETAIVRVSDKSFRLYRKKTEKCEKNIWILLLSFCFPTGNFILKENSFRVCTNFENLYFKYLFDTPRKIPTKLWFCLVENRINWKSFWVHRSLLITFFHTPITLKIVPIFKLFNNIYESTYSNSKIS